MLGKEKCRILKEIRQRIADENDIPYVTRECTHQGDCRGTCPRCESELRYLEQQLAARQALGKRVSVAALCAGMALGATGCGLFAPKPTPEPIDELSGAVPYEEPTPVPSPETEVEAGEIVWPEENTPCPTGGDEALPPKNSGEEEPEEFELMGDVAWIPEEQNA